MNIFQRIYLEDIITQENVKSLIPIVQSDLFQDFGVSNYADLLPNDKIKFQEKINEILNQIKQKVNTLTKNLQYQSWIYKILKQQDKEINQDYDVIKSALIDFQNLCKRPDLKPQQRNINNYSTFQDLQKFILSFQKQHKLDTNIYQNLKKLYANNTYTCYLITNYDQCNKLFGGNEYFNTGWCVAKSQKYFKNYLSKYKDQFNGYIVFIENSTNKPFALLHYGSGQFKDTSDVRIKNHDPAIIDCLYNLNSNLDFYKIDTDLYDFGYNIYKCKYPNCSYLEYYVASNNIKYDKISKILDCCNKVLYIDQKLLDENLFSYNIINCKTIKLTRL